MAGGLGGRARVRRPQSRPRAQAIRTGRRTCSRCSRTRPASCTWGTSSTTRSATSSRTSAAARATPCCGRWATTPSGCRPRTPRSARAAIRARSPSATSTRSGARCERHGLGDRLDARGLDAPSPSTTAGRSGSSCASCEAGLAYRKEAPVKWCPNDQTVLANEQVIDGRCERCGAEVIAKNLEQWFFRITDYADRLLDEMDAARVLARARADDAAQLDRPLRGRRDHLPGRGARRSMCPSSRRGPTRSSARRSSCSPRSIRWSASSSAAPSASAEVLDYVAARGGALGRRAGGCRAREDRRLHRPPVDEPGERRADPVWVADYVLMEYGTGAIMAVPAHDERDFEFARQFGLEISQVVEPADGGAVELPYVDEVGRRRARSNSGRFAGLPTPEAIAAIVALARGEGLRQGRGRLPPARLAALTAALLGLPDPGRPLRRLRDRPGARRRSCPCSSPRSTDYLPKGRSPLAAAEDWVATTCPALRRPGAARDRHDGHLRRLLLVLHALRRPAQRRAPFDRRSSTTGCRSASTSAASSTRSCTCSTRASSRRC